MKSLFGLVKKLIVLIIVGVVIYIFFINPSAFEFTKKIRGFFSPDTLTKYGEKKAEKRTTAPETNYTKEAEEIMKKNREMNKASFKPPPESVRQLNLKQINEEEKKRREYEAQRRKKIAEEYERLRKE